MYTEDTMLMSKTGEVKSSKEWHQEAIDFYLTLGQGVHVSDQWERYMKVLGLHEVGEVDRIQYRSNPVRHQREGHTKQHRNSGND